MNTKPRQRILVVDDDARLRDLLTRYLEEQGFTVKAVIDGASMDKALHREHFDILVLDLMLPGEDGLSICRRLRGREHPLPIIMLTAKGMKSIESLVLKWVLTTIYLSLLILANLLRASKLFYVVSRKRCRGHQR